MRRAWRRTDPRRFAKVPGGPGQLNRRGNDSESGFKRLARRDPLRLFLLLLAAIVLFSLPHEHQLALATAIRSSVLTPVLRLQVGVADARSTRARLQGFRAERDSLAAELLSLGDVDEENRRLRALLGLAATGMDRFKPANLAPAGRPGESVKRSFVLDIGAAQGVYRGAPVIAAEGLVGVVRVVAAGQATGDFWTHPEFRVSAMTTEGEVFGIIRALEASSLLMRLENTPYQAELLAGTELVTSGQGGVFPRGIPIGRVLELTGTQAGWARSYLVQPAVYPDAVREVMVLVDRATMGDLADLWERGTASDQR